MLFTLNSDLNIQCGLDYLSVDYVVCWLPCTIVKLVITKDEGGK